MATTILQQTGEWTEGGIPSASTSTSVTPDGQPVDDHKCTASSRTESDSPVETTDNAAANFSTKSSERLSSGEVAGVAIGCLVAGLVLGISAMFLLFRRRRGRNHAAINPSQTTKPDIEQKDGIQVSVTPSKNDVELSQFLLESTPDKEIEGELRSLSELIYQHVENHYHQSEVVGNSETLAQSLVDMGYSPEASRMEAEAVVAKCIAPKTRQVGLRHVLSHAIFRSLDFSSRSSLSILPPPVNALLEASLLVEGANSSGKTLPSIFRPQPGQQSG
ncbi:hypothetical protein NW762_009753 [Fusarium torreyae]|uniref:Uncharacterized protein n=1 Tax=Fusarium torreyae TaxID=1237075 RepID=A0A9W8RSX4_9HYPO|nr:hypothetical protein NW762_009753 [Fusarium torreyae]